MDLNSILAAQLASLFFPTVSPSGKRSYKPLSDTTELLLADPRYKFLGLKYVPQMPRASKAFSIESWEALESRVIQMQLGGSIEAEINWRLKANSRKSFD
jgi:hypothetical protein